MIIRFIFYVVVFYFLFHLIKRLKAAYSDRTSFQHQKKQERQVPYDPQNVEDIDYEELD
ncbi:MAG: hypothetical protein ACE5GL_04690 [Calditrichia bacterium]